MKIFLVPIPWTHDQYDNARWYVKHYEDLLIDQNDEKFLEILEKALLTYKNFKKNSGKKDKKKQIQLTKEIILKSIFTP